MFLLFLVVILLSNEFIYYTDDKIIIYSFVLAVFLLYSLAGNLLWKDFRSVGFSIKEEYFYYQYINLNFLKLLADLSFMLLRFKKLSFIVFGVTSVILKLINKYERVLFADKLIYGKVKSAFSDLKI